MYTTVNFKTKKELREAVKRGDKVRLFNPGTHGKPRDNGIEFVEGPHAPQPHKWYAKVTMVDGFVAKVD